MIQKIFRQWLKIPFVLKAHEHRTPRRHQQTIVFLHGIGHSSLVWRQVIDKLPADAHYVTVDLLGFGESPHPDVPTYDAATQAKSLDRTLRKLGVKRDIVLVGHSLGALISVEYAKRYQKKLDRLVLCSPPLYDIDDSKRALFPSADQFLRGIYETTTNLPDQFVALASVAMKYNLRGKSFHVTEDNVDSYMATLRDVIIDQTTLQDIQTLTLPITIIRGRFDPFLVPKNIKRLAKNNANITLRTIFSGHDIMGRYVNAVVSTLKRRIDKNEVNAA